MANVSKYHGGRLPVAVPPPTSSKGNYIQLAAAALSNLSNIRKRKQLREERGELEAVSFQTSKRAIELQDIINKTRQKDRTSEFYKKTSNDFNSFLDKLSKQASSDKAKAAIELARARGVSGLSANKTRSQEHALINLKNSAVTGFGIEMAEAQKLISDTPDDKKDENFYKKIEERLDAYHSKASSVFEDEEDKEAVELIYKNNLARIAANQDANETKIEAQQTRRNRIKMQIAMRGEVSNAGIIDSVEKFNELSSSLESIYKDVKDPGIKLRSKLFAATLLISKKGSLEREMKKKANKEQKEAFNLAKDNFTNDAVDSDSLDSTQTILDDVDETDFEEGEKRELKNKVSYERLKSLLNKLDKESFSKEYPVLEVFLSGAQKNTLNKISKKGYTGEITPKNVWRKSGREYVNPMFSAETGKPNVLDADSLEENRKVYLDVYNLSTDNGFVAPIFDNLTSNSIKTLIKEGSKSEAVKYLSDQMSMVKGKPKLNEYMLRGFGEVYPGLDVAAANSDREGVAESIVDGLRRDPNQARIREIANNIYKSMSLKDVSGLIDPNRMKSVVRAVSAIIVSSDELKGTNTVPSPDTIKSTLNEVLGGVVEINGNKILSVQSINDNNVFLEDDDFKEALSNIGNFAEVGIINLEVPKGLDVGSYWDDISSSDNFKLDKVSEYKYIATYDNKAVIQSNGKPLIINMRRMQLIKNGFNKYLSDRYKEGGTLDDIKLFFADVFTETPYKAYIKSDYAKAMMAAMDE